MLDQYGLLSSPGKGNALLYTSELRIIQYLTAKSDAERSEIRRAWVAAIRSCRKEFGIYNRHPENGDQESFDDYIGILSASKVMWDVHGDDAWWVANEILIHGASNNWVYQNAPADTFEQKLKCWLGRNPAFVAHVKMCAGEKWTLWDTLAWHTGLILAALSKSHDSKFMGWLKIKSFEKNSWTTRFFQSKLVEQYPGGMREVASQYFATPNVLTEIFID